MLIGIVWKDQSFRRRFFVSFTEEVDIRNKVIEAQAERTSCDPSIKRVSGSPAISKELVGSSNLIISYQIQAFKVIDIPHRCRLSRHQKLFRSSPSSSADYINSRFGSSDPYGILPCLKINETTPAASIDHYFQASCSAAQQELDDLKSKTPTATIEESCIFATQMYIDKILLNAPAEQIFGSAAN